MEATNQGSRGTHKGMDYLKAREFLTDFATRARSANDLQRKVAGNYWENPDWIKIDLELQERLIPVQRVMAALGLSTRRVEPDRGMYATVWDDAFRAVHQAIGAIDHDEAVEEIVGGGPALESSALHTWVWSVAAPIWATGMFRLAIQSAATNVDNMTKAKLHRTDLSGSKLAGEAWAQKDPSAGRPRLRPTGFGEPGDESYESALAGARGLHTGAMHRIRNLTTHSTDELDEQVALEQLATLSFVARLVDDAEVVWADRTG